jgi:hypothetical protein
VWSAMLGASALAAASIGVATAQDSSVDETAPADEQTATADEQTETDLDGNTLEGDDGTRLDQDDGTDLTEGSDDVAESDDTGSLDDGRDGTTTRGSSDLDGAGDSVASELVVTGAEIELLNLDDDNGEYLRLTFDEDIDEIADADGFFVQGVDPANVVDADDAVRSEEDSAAVIVEFPADTDLEQYALAGARTGAVERVDGKQNVLTTTTLDDSGLTGATTAPDLQSVSANEDLEWLIFTFDEELDDGAANASSFGYHTLDGTLEEGSDIRSTDDETVIVAFDGNVEDAVRYVVEADAVTDTQGQGNLIETLGSATAKPDLTDAELTGDTTVRFSFDEAIRDVEPSAFIATTVDGTRHAGEHAALVDGGEEVEVVFPAINDFQDEIVRVSAEPEAAAANDRNAPDLTAGAVQLDSSTDAVGDATAGPDPLAVDLDDETGFVTITFDEQVDDDRLDEVDEGGFHLVSDAGHATRGEFVVDISGDTVTIAFPEDAAVAADAVTIDEDAVRDFAGTPNPAATLQR